MFESCIMSNMREFYKLCLDMVDWKSLWLTCPIVFVLVVMKELIDIGTQHSFIHVALSYGSVSLKPWKPWTLADIPNIIVCAVSS